MVFYILKEAIYLAHEHFVSNLIAQKIHSNIETIEPRKFQKFIF